MKLHPSLIADAFCMDDYLGELKEKGFFNSSLTVQEMMDLNIEHASRFRPQEYYEIPTRDPSFTIDWIHFPKNGNTYTLARFGIEGYGNEYRGLHPDFWSEPSTSETWRKNLKLLIVRDPVDRAISSFQHMIRQPFNENIGTLTPHITIKMEFFKKYLEDRTFNIDESFLLFLQELKKYGFYDKHTFPQTKFITDMNIDLSPSNGHKTLFVDFADLNHQLTTICDNYGICGLSHEEAYSTHRNNTSQELKQILHYYIKQDIGVKRLIEKLYEPDFDLYKMARGNL